MGQPVKKKTREETLSSGALFIVAIIWGTGFVMSQRALDAGLSSSFIMMCRFWVAAILIGVIFFKKIRQHFTWDQLGSGIVIGVLLFAAFYVQIIGLDNSSPSNNAFITSSNVVIVPFLWWAVSRKRPEKIYFISSFISLLGIAILSVDFSGGFSLGFGDVLSFVSAILFASQIVATGVLALRMDHRVLVFLQFFVAAICATVTFLITDRDLSGFANMNGMLAVVYLGAFSTCLCFFLQTVAQKNLSSSKAAIILATEALFGTLFSVLVGYDAVNVRMIVGGVFIFLAIILPDLIQGRKRRAPAGPPDGA